METENNNLTKNNVQGKNLGLFSLKLIIQKIRGKEPTFWSLKDAQKKAITPRKEYKNLLKDFRGFNLALFGIPPYTKALIKQATDLIDVICGNIEQVEYSEDKRSDEDKLKSKNTDKSLPREIPSDIKHSKGFCGLPLNFLPNVRKSEVKTGNMSKVLGFFGINKKLGTSVKLYMGPNKKANRYLKHQYSRLITSIGGRIMYKKVYSEQCNTHVDIAHVVWVNNLTNINMDSIDLRQQKILKAKYRKFWTIAINLLVNSRNYRLTLLMKSLGKKERWFHRDIVLPDLANINQNYLKIVKNRETKTPMKRSWIPQINKFRPLAVAPIEWRMYTGGLANFLYVYLNCNWPENQHGYTCGRGVNTAWEFILKNVIKASYIFEFDLVGYFNNITHRCVARTLAESNVPKWVIILIMEVSTSDIKNISARKAKELLDPEVYPDPYDFKKDWEKHEYIHKFREGWRPRGFGQGNSLSPIVSVFPLLLTKLLEKHGIKCISYCDDGILYGNVYADYFNLLQNILNEGDTGVKISGPKSSWVKLAGEWQHPLKFVGMIYDPVKNILSASTRSGSTLPMSVDLIGLVSESEKLTSDILNLDEHKEAKEQWGTNINELDLSNNPFDISELNSLIYQSNIWKSMGLIPPHLLNFYWNKWNFLTTLRYILAENPISEEWSVTKRLAYNDKGIWQYYFNMEKIDKSLAEGVIESLKFVENVYNWTYIPVGYSKETWENNPERLYTLMQIMEYRSQLSNSLSDVVAPGETLQANVSTPSLMKSRVDLLCWYKTEIKNQLFENFDNINRELNLQSHEDMRMFKLDPLSVLFDKLPNSALAIAIRENWNVTLTISRLNWENTVNTKLFNTLIARLFANSFDLSNTKQDFKLEWAASSLMDCITSLDHRNPDKLSIRRKFAMILHNKKGFDTFNSTTTAAFVLNALIKLWDNTEDSNLKNHNNINDFWCSMYSKLSNRLVDRRTGSMFSFKDFGKLAILMKGKNPFFRGPRLTYEDLEIRELIANGIKGIPASKKFKIIAKLKADKILKKGLPIDAIIYANCSENMSDEVSSSKRISFFRDSLIRRNKGTDWLTWAPYIFGPRRSSK